MDRQHATMLLVGDVANRTVILIDDLADTSNTITRAAKLLKKEGAVKVYALITHGVLSGDALERINASALDKLIVTNSVPQEEHVRLCPKLEVIDVAHVFAEVSLSLILSSTSNSARQYDVSIMARASVYYSRTTDQVRLDIYISASVGRWRRSHSGTPCLW